MAYRNGSTDREVGEALRQGDPAATRRLYDLYAPGLFAYACGFVDGSTASDVVYDSVWIATRRIDALRDIGLLRAWLYAIVRSECGRQGRVSGSVGFVPTTDPAAPPLRPEVYAVRDAVGELGATEREVLELSVRHHFTAQEIDAILGSVAGDGRSFARAQEAVDLAVPTVPNATGLFASLPPVPLPPRLRDRVLTAIPLDTELTDMGRRIEPLNRNGFPTVRRGRGKRSAIVVAAVAAVVALAVVAVAARPAPDPADPPAPTSQTSRPMDRPPSPAAVVTVAPTSETTTPVTTTTEPVPEPAVPVAETTVDYSPPASSLTTTPLSTSTAAPTTTSTQETTTRYPRRTRPADESRDEDERKDERPATPTAAPTRTAQPTTTTRAAANRQDNAQQRPGPSDTVSSHG